MGTEPLLSKDLLREVRPEFFRLLSGSSAPLYIDVIDALEVAASHVNGGLPRDEALSIAEGVIESHGEVILEDESAAEPFSAREKARLLLDRLLGTGWLEEEQRADWQRLIFFDPNGVTLTHALRKMARPEAAVFSDKIVNVCVTLASRDAVAAQPWAQVESCLANLQAGLGELRAMQKSIERHIRQQLVATTLKQSLSVLFDQFAPRFGRGCYAELVRARLPIRLAEARRGVDELAIDPAMLSAMQTEVLRREPFIDVDSAMRRVQARLDELSELLDQVVPLADAVDRRTAEFTRRSLARFRYLQEVAGENRSRVQLFFETLNQRLAGQRLNEVDALEIPAMRVHDVRYLAGLDSLYTPRLRRSAAEIEPLDDETSESQQGHALGQLRSAMRDSLTVGRANRFVESLPAKLGSRIHSQDLPMHTEDDLADVIACLLHAHASDAVFQIEVPRAGDDAALITSDVKLCYRIERFVLVKK
ncbi:MAG: hypothetical protein JWL90_1931 [Chthoniobacteraceae bacterium]|nr:hypothetical protein [Chthoniobacteraceae bacterium]